MAKLYREKKKGWEELKYVESQMLLRTLPFISKKNLTIHKA